MVMERKFKQRLPTPSPISRKKPITSHLKSLKFMKIKFKE